MNSSYYHLFCVRDSEKSIDRVIRSLLDQTVPPEEIIVVNDGSSDATGDILDLYQNEMPDVITVYKTQNKARDYSRIPALWNMCIKKNYDFHMIGAGDVSYDKRYSERLLDELQNNPKLVICSGDFDPFISKAPHGAGRFVRQSFFFKHYERYLEIMGYESEILHRALLKSLEIRVFNDVRMEHHDKLGHGHNFKEFGKGMKALGYHPAYAFGRCVLEFMRNDSIGRLGVLNMFWNYVTYKPQSSGYFSLFPEDIRKEIRDLQRKEVQSCLRKFMKDPRKIKRLF